MHRREFQLSLSTGDDECSEASRLSRWNTTESLDISAGPGSGRLGYSRRPVGKQMTSLRVSSRRRPALAAKAVRLDQMLMPLNGHKPGAARSEQASPYRPGCLPTLIHEFNMHTFPSSAQHSELQMNRVRTGLCLFDVQACLFATAPAGGSVPILTGLCFQCSRHHRVTRALSSRQLIDHGQGAVSCALLQISSMYGVVAALTYLLTFDHLATTLS